MPLLSGLETVHQAGFRHRDIKPENIYLTKNGRPVLLDFGSARQAISNRSMAMTSIVTAGYAPFEQYHEDGNQGAWSDIYALSAVMFRAITGKKPPEATRRLKEDPCEKLSARYAGQYDAEFLRALDQGLAVDEAKRPQTVAAWRKAFGSSERLPVASSSAQPVQSVQPAKAGKNQKVAPVPKSDKIEDAIVGKWLLDKNETTLFLKDKTFEVVTDDGHTAFGRYFFLKPNQLQFFFFNGDSDAPFLWSDIAIKGDTLTRVIEKNTITYHRVETYEDSAGVTGLWTSATDGSPFIIFTVGTFVFGRAVIGTWEGQGGHVLARNSKATGATWDLTLSSDGHTLTGPWQTPKGEKGTATIKRPKFDKLADYILGRWQLVGHIQTQEYKKDGTVFVTNDDGGAKTFNYSVTDENHIQTALPGVPMKLPVWTIERVDDDVLTNQPTPQGKPFTSVRIR
jgi:hypothetical protein